MTTGLALLAPVDLLARVATAPISGGPARRAAQQELSRPQYHRDDPSLINRVLSWLSDHLDRLGNASAGGSALAVVAVIIVAGVVFMVIRAGRPTRSAHTPGPDGDQLRPANSVDHTRLAQELTGSGRYAEALREWLRATVQTLEARGVLDERPGRTADDIARTAGAELPDAAASLLAATDAFDRIWFGGSAADADDAEAGRVAAAAVRQARIRSSPAVPAGYAAPR